MRIIMYSLTAYMALFTNHIYAESNPNPDLGGLMTPLAVSSDNVINVKNALKDLASLPGYDEPINPTASFSRQIVELSEAASNVKWLSGSEKHACEALLCLASGMRPSQCTSALTEYFSIWKTRWWKTMVARGEFLKICPTESSGSPAVDSSVLANLGSSATDALSNPYISTDAKKALPGATKSASTYEEIASESSSEFEDYMVKTAKAAQFCQASWLNNYPSNSNAYGRLRSKSDLRCIMVEVCKDEDGIFGKRGSFEKGKTFDCWWEPKTTIVTVYNIDSSLPEECPNRRDHKYTIGIPVPAYSGDPSEWWMATVPPETRWCPSEYEIYSHRGQWH